MDVQFPQLQFVKIVKDLQLCSLSIVGFKQDKIT